MEWEGKDRWHASMLTVVDQVSLCLWKLDASVELWHLALDLWLELQQEKERERFQLGTITVNKQCSIWIFWSHLQPLPKPVSCPLQPLRLSAWMDCHYCCCGATGRNSPSLYAPRVPGWPTLLEDHPSGFIRYQRLLDTVISNCITCTLISLSAWYHAWPYTQPAQTDINPSLSTKDQKTVSSIIVHITFYTLYNSHTNFHFLSTSSSLIFKVITNYLATKSLLLPILHLETILHK